MSRLWFAGKIDKFRLMAKFDFRTSAKLWRGVSNMFSMTTLLHGWHAQIKLSWDTIPVSRQSQWLEKPLEKVQLCCAPQLSISKCTENINVWQIRTKPDWSPCLLGRCIFNGAGPWYQVLPRGSPITWGETKNLPVCWWSFVACRRGRYGSCWRMRCRSQKLRGCFRTSFWILDLDKGKPQDSQGHGTFMLNSFGDFFFRFLNFHYDIVMSDWWEIPIWNPLTCSSNFGLRVPFTSPPGCSSRLAGQTPVPGRSSSRVHLVKKFTKNSKTFNNSFCIILPMALLLERWIVTMSRVTSRELIILYYSFVASHLHVTCSCFSLWMMIVG